MCRGMQSMQSIIERLYAKEEGGEKRRLRMEGERWWWWRWLCSLTRCLTVRVYVTLYSCTLRNRSAVFVKAARIPGDSASAYSVIFFAMSSYLIQEANEAWKKVQQHQQQHLCEMSDTVHVVLCIQHVKIFLKCNATDSIRYRCPSICKDSWVHILCSAFELLEKCLQMTWPYPA